MQGELCVFGLGGFLAVAPGFDEDYKAIGGGGEEAGADEEPFVAAAHDAEGDVDGVAYEIANPGVDVFAHHEEGGHSLEGKDGTVERGQVGVEHAGVEQVGGGGDGGNGEQRPERIAPADGATVVLLFLFPDEYTADGGQQAIDLESEAHVVLVGEEVVAQDEAGDYAEYPSPAVAAGGKIDGGDLGNGDENGEYCVHVCCYLRLKSAGISPQWSVSHLRISVV